MSTVLKRKLTKKDSDADIMDAILKLATNKFSHVSFSDHCDWLETKMCGIARLARILKKRQAAEAAERTSDGT